MKTEKESKKSTHVDKNDEKILFGEKASVCFACGEKIDSDIKICPYCNTKQVIDD